MEVTCGAGTAFNATSNTCEIQCTSANGRRMAASSFTEMSLLGSHTAPAADVLGTYMATLTPNAQKALFGHLNALDQLFGQPTLA